MGLLRVVNFVGLLIIFVNAVRASPVPSPRIGKSEFYCDCEGAGCKIGSHIVLFIPILFFFFFCSVLFSVSLQCFFF